MSAESPVPSDHPMMQAWNAYKQTDDFANSAKWALEKQHTPGSLWAAFVVGWNAAMRHANEADDAAFDAFVQR